MIALLFLLFTFATFSQTNKPAIIRGFDGKTYIKYPNEKKWIEADSVDTNYVGNSNVKVEYTNFNGETIDLIKRNLFMFLKKDDLVSTINFANDPAKDYYVLYFKLREKSKVMIQVYTTDNVRISDLYWEEYDEGMNKVNIEKRYNRGTYVIYMTIDDKVFKHRVLFD